MLIQGTWKNLADAESFAQRIAALALFGKTISLTGDLGAGKTTLVRFLAEQLGSPVAASSPTFVLSHEYPLRDGHILEHWDIYRLRGAVPPELLEPCATNTLRLVEWGNLAGDSGSLFDYELALKISADNPEIRDVTFRSF